MLLAERVAPLRRTVESKLRRVARNLTIGGISLVLTPLLQAWLLQPVASWIVRERVGLLQAVQWPRWLETAIALILLDYTLWWWHWANHRVPFFWRFHLVHHVDRDLDATTALRFHFGEHALSIGWRLLQVVAIGPSPVAIWTFNALLVVSIVFHHSNTRLPARLERLLVRLVVTPRMHGIHHAQREEWTNSNWASILTVWDSLHRTLRLDVPDDAIVIGVPAYADPGEVTLGSI